MAIGKRAVTRKLSSYLVGLSALAVLAWIALPLLTSPAATHRRSSCSSRMWMHFRGLQSYLSNYDGWFPLAWHVGGRRLSEDLSNLTYYRALISEQARVGFSRLARPGRDPVSAQKQKFAEIQKLWTDPTQGGWTTDCLAPDSIFRMPDQGDSRLIGPPSMRRSPAAVCPPP